MSCILFGVESAVVGWTETNCGRTSGSLYSRVPLGTGDVGQWQVSGLVSLYAWLNILGRRGDMATSDCLKLARSQEIVRLRDRAQSLSVRHMLPMASSVSLERTNGRYFDGARRCSGPGQRSNKR